jgi:hypothetical protein
MKVIQEIIDYLYFRHHLSTDDLAVFEETGQADDVIVPSELRRFRIKGGGGSNMSPSLRMLAEDPDVEAVVVITDCDIIFPEEEMPYSVLRASTEPSYADSFEPGYGRVIVLPPARD